MIPIGLILEGGGMRGAFTAGVLDFFQEKELWFSSVYGVSAGACQACSYLCHQPGRGIRVWKNYLNDKRFCSVSSLLRTGNLFNAHFNYDMIPRQLDPIDQAAFDPRQVRFISVVTNLRTGQAEYLPIRDMLGDMALIQATASLPLISRPVVIDGKKYLDGGVADSIPLEKSVADGNRKNVLILTQAPDYQKEANRAMPLLSLRYSRYPAFLQAMRQRHIRYNDTLRFIRAEQAQGKAFVIQPDQKPEIGRIERDPAKLERLYQIGYEKAQALYPALLAFLHEPLQV